MIPWNPKKPPLLRLVLACFLSSIVAVAFCLVLEIQAESDSMDAFGLAIALPVAVLFLWATNAFDDEGR